MKLRNMVRRAIKTQGIRTIKDTAKKTGVSAECLRKFLNGNGIPKDTTLLKIAKGLGMDGSLLLLAAHRERMSSMAVNNLLKPTAPKYEKKRVWPFSEEQCDYLEKMINRSEIQLLRMYRQVDGEGQIQIRGYVDFMFAAHRQEPPTEGQELPLPG